MEQDTPAQVQDPHRALHSQTGARPGEHPGRPGNPLVKAAGLAWLEFEKPDLDRAERFYADFGFTVADRTPQTLLLRGRRAAAACLVVRRGPHARFVGPAFQAAVRDEPGEDPPVHRRDDRVVVPRQHQRGLAQAPQPRQPGPEADGDELVDVPAQRG